MRDDDALDNNPQVTRRALEAIHADLYGWSLTRCDYDRAAAEDLMQQAYVEVLSGRARFDNKSTLKTFLFGVVQMLARSRYRRATRRLRLARQAGAEAGPATTVDAHDDGRSVRVWAAVRALPARQRDITELVFCRELTIGEASRVMGVTVGTGRVHYDRAKKALAAALADLRDDGRDQ